MEIACFNILPFLFTETITPERKSFFFQNYMTSVIKDIKDKELHDKEQKIYRNLFYFYILKELSPKIFFINL